MTAVERWMAAVALGGRGRYAAAAAELGRLLADPRVPPGIAAHAAVTRAAHRRQVGGHAAARRDDALGLRLAAGAPPADPDADGTDPRAARIDALIGLAADAVGLGAPDTASRHLDAAHRAAEAHPSWRAPVRLGWVRAETALVAGRAADAIEPARRALEGARSAGSARHELKSRLVLAVAGAAAGAVDPVRSVTELDAIAADGTRLGLLPLVWPCHAAAADLLDRAGRCHANDATTRTAQSRANGTVNDPTRRRHAAAATLSVISQWSDPVGRRLMGESVWVPRRPRVM